MDKADHKQYTLPLNLENYLAIIMLEYLGNLTPTQSQIDQIEEQFKKIINNFKEKSNKSIYKFQLKSNNA